MSKLIYPHTTYVRWRSTADVGRLPRWLCVVQAIVAYEWLVSGLNKLLNPGFDTHLVAMLQQSLHGNPYGWYIAVLQRWVIPNCAQCAQLVAWGETLVGSALLLSAVLWIIRPDGWLAGLLGWTAVPALVAAAVMNVNYYLLASYGLPWVNPANAYDEGVHLDALLALICLALLGANMSALRWRRSAREPAPQPALLRNAA